jgi:hypothetical protein
MANNATARRCDKTQPPTEPRPSRETQQASADDRAAAWLRDLLRRGERAAGGKTGQEKSPPPAPTPG